MRLEPVSTSLHDREILFNWRNDRLTRAMSVNTGPVAWETHCEWFRNRMSRPSPDLYFAHTDDDVYVGVVRIDDDEISYTVSPAHRGKGICTAMLKEAVRRFGTKKAEIKPENIASIKAAERAGLTVVLLTPARGKIVGGDHRFDRSGIEGRKAQR